jgi:hypothetical protein
MNSAGLTEVIATINIRLDVDAFEVYGTLLDNVS